jgi:DNA (cytosine-5)-methyltransferase 1
MRYGSVCSGIEAATRAWHPLGWEPVFFSEIETFPSAVLAHHYGSNMPGEPLSKNGVPNYGDFTTIGADAGPIDLLVGGTPCQSFSVAGKRLGLDDPRGNLALEYLALARRLRARWIVWENVPGVLSSHSSDEQAEEEVEGDEGLESADFATFLSFVQECGYGFAYRVLDAQFIRVDEYARAVPQRRRRVFLVGYLGDWRRAAAVLLEPESMRGDPAPRREAGQRAAPTIASRPTGGGGLGTDFDLDGGLIHAQVAATLPAGGNSTGGARQPGMGAETAATMLVAHSLRAEGFDASEDGTGRGTSIVPVFAPSTAATLTRGAERAGKGGYAGRRQEDESNLVAFDTTQITSKANRSVPRPGDPCQPLAAGAHAPAIAIQERAVSENVDAGPQGAGYSDDGAAYTLEARHHVQAVQIGWAVRRLMPVECERLQGFPDNFTNVPWRGKDHAPDGPRYKALGNSMAVNAMQWIGQRIQMVEDVIAHLGDMQ